MIKNKFEQKLVSFTENPGDLDKISADMQAGWSIVSLVKNGSYYVGIMEYNPAAQSAIDSVYIPPRKKIKIFG